MYNALHFVDLPKHTLHSSHFAKHSWRDVKVDRLAAGWLRRVHGARGRRGLHGRLGA
jgi:hypothetical protein